MKRSLGLVALPLLVGGCLPLPITVASTAFTGISYVASGKSTTDHALSATMEQDCALTRPLFGEPFCRDVGPHGEGRTETMLVARYPGDRDGRPVPADSRDDGTLDLASLLRVDSRQVAAAPQFLVAPPRVSVAGIIVTKDQLVPAPGVQVLPASADASWAALGASKEAAVREAAVAEVAIQQVAVQEVAGADRWVVLGSFREAWRAQVMVTRHADRVPRILDATVDGRHWHRVAVGPMPLDRAREVRDDLGRIDGRDPWVVRLGSR